MSVTTVLAGNYEICITVNFYFIEFISEGSIHIWTYNILWFWPMYGLKLSRGRLRKTETNWRWVLDKDYLLKTDMILKVRSTGKKYWYDPLLGTENIVLADTNLDYV